MAEQESGHKPVLTLHEVPVNNYPEFSGEGVCLWWLGQAGFLIRYRNLTLLIDPYLSNFLAGKYAGKKYPHRRMMPPPVPPESLADVDFCFCTHSHSDHMDPGFLPVLVKTSPDCRFVLPRASVETARERGIPDKRMIPVNAGDKMTLTTDLRLEVIPSAHEKLSVTDEGSYPFLGYFLTLGDLQVYHPGDCVPYPELKSWFGNRRPDLALLPVNGRREELSREGIAGNFSFGEACGLMDSRKIGFMIPHHYGMFDFNTADPELLKKQIREQGRQGQVFPAETGTMYRLERENYG